MAFQSFSRAAQAMVQRRRKTLPFLRPVAALETPPRVFGAESEVFPLRVFAAGFSSDYLNLDDLPPPSSMPRTRSFLSNKRSSLSRRLAAREVPDELSDFHGLANSTFQETLERLDRLDKIGIRPHPATYAGLLQSAGNRVELENGKLIHDHIMSYKFDKDMALVGLILQMYRRCKSPEGARKWFDSREKKNMYMWTCMISTYCQYGCRAEALEIYEMLKKEELNPEKEAFLALVSVISGAENMQDGRLVHEHIYRSPYKLDVDVGTGLVRMYGRCANVKDALKMFRMLPERNSAAWNALKSAYAQNQRFRDAIDVFEVMLEQDEFPDNVSFASALAACASEGVLGKGMQIHSRLPRNALETDKRVLISLIQLYGKCGSLQEAQRIFDEMKDKDVIAWNTLIKANAEHGRTKQVLSLFKRMKTEGGTPNRVTYICSLSACANEAALMEGKDIYAIFTSSGLELDAGVAIAFIYMFGRCGSLQEAREVFDKVTNGRHLILWNVMIVAYAMNGHKEEALHLFDQMQKEGVVLDSSSHVSTLSTYGRSSPEFAKVIFEKLPDKSVAAWNAMIATYVQHGDGKQALDFFKQMQQQGVTPDKATFVSILSAFSGPSYLAEAKDMHLCISRSGLEADSDVAIALIKMYGKCGSVDEARGLFERTPTQDLPLWDALIAVYAHNGKEKEAIEAFRGMQQADLVPGKSTFVYALSACASHDALDDGKQLHELIMRHGFEFDTRVANALIGMFAKCGSVESAKKAFDKAVMCDVISWTFLIAAHAQNGQEEEALRLFKKMQEEGIISDKISYHNLLSASSQGILAEESLRQLLSINHKSGMMPAAEHFSCLVDLLGTSGQLDEAEKFIYNIPFEPPNAVYSKLTEENSFQFNFKLPLY